MGLRDSCVQQFSLATQVDYTSQGLHGTSNFWGVLSYVLSGSVDPSEMALRGLFRLENGGHIIKSLSVVSGAIPSGHFRQ